MKTSLLTLIYGFLALITFLPGAVASGQPEFEYLIESRSADTNRTKFDNQEFEVSCGTGSVLFKVYRDYRTETTTDYDWINGSSHAHLSVDELNLDHSYMDGDIVRATNYHYYHSDFTSDSASCSYTDDNGDISGTHCEGNFTSDFEDVHGWADNIICDDNVSELPTLRISSNYCGASFGQQTMSRLFYTKEELSSEYTTPELVDASDLTYPTDWGTGGGSANCSITDATVNGEAVHDAHAELNKLQYRFKVIAPKGQAFRIDYEIWTQYEGEEATNSPAFITGIGTGGWAYYPDQPLELLPPYKQNTVDGCPDYVGGTRSLRTLCGGTVGGTCGMSCTASPGGINASLSDYGLSASMNLGRGNFGEESGSLLLAGSYPTNTLTTPAGLGLAGSLQNLEIFRSGDDLRQVKAPQVLADIVTLSSTSYEVRFYTNAGSIGGSGLYEPVGSPFSVGKVEQISSTNHIRLTVSNGSSHVYDYEWSSADGGWMLTSGGGIRQEMVGWDEATLTRSNTVRNAASALVFQETSQYLDLTNYGRVISKRIVGTGASAQTNLWFYYNDQATDGTNYGSVKLTIEPSGFWKSYQYDHLARITNEVSQFLNAATNAAESLCRVVRYDYTSLDGTNNCQTRIELLQGVEIAREYTVTYPDATYQIRCTTPGASWTNANNLVTITYYQSDTNFVGKLERVISPDGTLQLYQYQDSGDRTMTVLSGQPNGGDTDVVDGMETVSVTDPYGTALSRYSYDIVLGDSYLLDYETYAHDSLGRLTTTTYLDGTTTTVNYDCCGVDSLVDRDGVTTTYVFDPLHRQIGTIRNDITTTNLLDAAGNVLATIRVGSDDTTQLLRQASYDTAGRLINETNALSGVTSYTQAFDGSGQTVKTNTYPDNGQRIETYYQDGSLKSVTGSAAFPVYYDYGAYSNGTYTKETKGSSGGSEWVKSYSDMLGRSWKTEYADGAASTNYYNAQGQLEKVMDPDGVTRLYTYNGLGQTDQTILDVDRNGAGTDAVDRITRITNNVINYSGYAARHSRVYQTADNGSEILVSERMSVPALQTSISLSYGLGTTNVTAYPGGQQRTVTTTHPDGSTTTSTYTNGLLASVTRSDVSYDALPALTYAYDAHGRQYQVIDARNGATTYTYNAADQVQTVTTPSPDGVAGGLVTTTYYDPSLRATNVIQPDATSTRTDYFANGLPQKTWGSRIYPVEYQYDQAGRMTNMTTWQDFNESTGAGATGSAATKWLYDTSRGWLNQKKYADNTGPSYTYTAAGRLKSRAWVRGVTTWYTNNNAGELWVVNYTDATADVTNTYDRRGRLTNVLSGATSLTKVYNDAGNLLSENYSGGPLNGIFVTNRFDGLLRRTNVSIFNSPSSLLSSSAYGYDAASRLLIVSDGTSSAAFSFLANSPLVEQITFATNGTTVMTTTKSYDFVNRLTNTTTLDAGAATLDTHLYKYNSASQRTSVTNVDGSYWVYTYDSMGQVTSGNKYWSDNTAVAGQQFDYTFDDIGNRQTTTRDTRSATYTPNTLNQYTSRDVPGYVNVLGTATNTATVSLWSKESTALYTSTTRKGDYFRGEVPFNNTTGALWLTITNVAALSNYTGADIITNIAGSRLLAKTPESFTYDSDGNLTSDSLWTNVWNGENRRITVESRSTLPATGKAKEDWTILADGRWIERIVSTNNGTTYYPSLTNRYVWDNQALLAVLDHTNGVVVSFMRGIDMSGSLQGAGGVGGVLAVKAGSSAQCGSMANTAHFPCYDGNGNVTALVNAATGEESARYEYGPFAEKLRETGPMAKLNPARFSTQYADDVAGDTKYLFRDYSANTGRWLNRDPIEEAGGKGLYSFLMNNSPTAIDALGLRPLRTSCNCCCECAESITISNPQYQKYPLNDSVGHIFDVDIVLSYRSVSLPFCPGGPKFKWEEKSNRPPDWLVKIGAKPNEWYDAFELEKPKDPKDPFSLPESYKDDKWEKRTKTCEVPTRTIRTGDFPTADLRQGKRVLQFRLSIINPPQCKCPEPVVKATAVQIIDPGASPVGTFTIPDPSQ